MALITTKEQADLNAAFKQLMHSLGYRDEILSSLGFGDALAQIGTVPSPLIINPGTIGAPAYTFVGHTDTGMWYDTYEGRLRFSTGGNAFLDVGSFGINVNGSVYISSGSILDAAGPMGIGSTVATGLTFGNSGMAEMDFNLSNSHGIKLIDQFGATYLIMRGTSQIDLDVGGSLFIAAGNAGILSLGNGGMATGGSGSPAGLRLNGPVMFNVAGRETTSATAGSNGDVPVQVAKYLTVTLSDGNNYKIPCYNL